MLMDAEKAGIVLVDVQEKLFPLIQDHNDIAKACQWILSFAADLQLPCLVSEQYPEGLGKTISSLSSLCLGSPYLEKMHFSCAQEKRLESFLNEYTLSQCIIIGIEAHVCVLQTVMELIGQGKEVFVIEEGVGSRNVHDKKLALQRMSLAGASIVSKEMFFFEMLRTAEHPRFKDMSKKYLQ